MCENIPLLAAELFYLSSIKLQRYRTVGANGEVMKKSPINIVLPLAIVTLCLLGQALSGHCVFIRDFQAALLSADWMLLVCLVVWCGTFVFLTFSRNNWPLIGLLSIATAIFFIGYTKSLRALDALTL